MAGADPIPAVAGPNRAQAEQYLQQGLDHYDRQEMEPALEAYRAAIAADPTFALGYNNVGMVLIDLERYEEALTALARAIQCDFNYAEAFNNLGFMLRRLGRNVEAASAYARFLELEPELEEAPRIRSWMETVQRENGLSALPPFSSELLGTPSGPGGGAAETAPAAVLSMTGAPGGASPAPRLSVDSGGVVPPVLGDAAVAPVVLLPPLPQPAASPVMAPIAVPAPLQAPVARVPVPAPEPEPAEMTALIEQGMDQFSEGNLSEAASIFQKALAADPKNAEAHTGLGKVLMRQEKMEEGLAELQRALESDPDDPATLYVLGFGLRALERNEDAALAYSRFLEVLPGALDGDKIRQWISHIHGIAGLGGGSTTSAEDASVIDDEQIVTDNDRKYKDATRLFQEGKLDKALRICVAVLNEDAAHVRTRVLLGRVLLRQKNHEGAVEQLEGALVTRPDFVEALYFLGQAYEKLGQGEKSVLSYTRYLQTAPNGPRAERLRQWLMNQSAAAETSGGDADKTAQCELCLRFFPAPELTQHEGKLACRNCLAVMGAAAVLAPTMLKEPAQEPEPALQPGPVVVEIPVPPSTRRSPVSLAIGVMVALLAMVVVVGVGMPYLSKLRAGKPSGVNGTPNVPQSERRVAPPPGAFDASKVKLVHAPGGEAWPFARWTFSPELAGLEKSQEQALGVKVGCVLGKGAPAGMGLSGQNTVTWTPQIADAALLKNGQNFNTSLTVKGVDASGHELFSLGCPLSIRVQFAYVLGPAVNLDLRPGEDVALASADLNGDKLADLVAVSGDYRRGAARVYLQRADETLPVPTQLLSGARYSAACCGDFDDNGSDDLIVANWHTGELNLFHQEAQQPVCGGTLKAGAGPLALAAAKMDDNGRPQIAALLGMGRSLVISSLLPGHVFGPATVVELPAGGAPGFLFPWKSPEAGPGFVAISPLAEAPIIFVGWNKGAWDKGRAPVASAIDGADLIVAAAALRAPGGRASRLALLTAGSPCRLLLLDEKDGRFSPVGKPMVLPDSNVGLLACDFNWDGQDDVFVVGREESGFYFVDADGMLQPGPRVEQSARMLGPAVVFRKLPNGPELLLLDDERKGHLLTPVDGAASVQEVAAPPAVAPTDKTPAAAPQPKAGQR